MKRKRTKNERTIHANETNKKRKQYEISVNLNDPGSVSLKSDKIWITGEFFLYQM
jgi:hypothetical protein